MKGKHMNNEKTEWCSIPVTVDDTVADLFHMAPPNHDANQKPEFRVTNSTMSLVGLDFDRYKPSLERMASHWLEEKDREMKKAKAQRMTKVA